MIGIGACAALLFGGVSSCSMMAGSGVGGVFTSSYLSEDADMLAAEAAYCEMEEELRYLDNYEAQTPDMTNTILIWTRSSMILMC